MSAVEYVEDQPAGFKNRIEKVAIVGAAGYLGQNFTRELLATGKHTVTALTRADSKNVLPAGVVKAVVDYDDPATLVRALAGQDFLIITLSIRAPPERADQIADAAQAAGVRWVMPNAYGPNPLDDALYDDMGFGPAFRARLHHILGLGLRPVVLSCGFWYEFSLAGGTLRYGFDLVRRRFVRFDRGDVKIHTSTLPQCGRAVAALLSLPVLPSRSSSASAASSSSSSPSPAPPTLSDFVAPQRVAYIQSFHVSQEDMFASVKRVTGTADADWTVSSEPARARWENASQLLKAAGGPRGTAAGVHLDGKTPLSAFEAFGMTMYSRIFFPGSDGLQDKDFVNDALGLPQEDLDEWTKEAVRLAETGALNSYGQ